MIFYFTGTGNSLAAAQRLAKRDTLVSIGACLRKNEFKINAGKSLSIGFVLPVYCFGIPSAVREFISKLKLTKLDHAYIFLVLTCAGKTGAAAKMFAKDLKKIGITLDANFSIVYPNNCIILSQPPIPHLQTKIYKEAGKAISSISEKILKRLPGDHDKLKGFLPSLTTTLLYPLYSHFRNTSKFTVDRNCRSCGLCAKICPVNAIQISNGHPVWTESKCTLCLACINRCQWNAINYGKNTVGRRRFINHLSGF